MSSESPPVRATSATSSSLLSSKTTKQKLFYRVENTQSSLKHTNHCKKNSTISIRIICLKPNLRERSEKTNLIRHSISPPESKFSKSLFYGTFPPAIKSNLNGSLTDTSIVFLLFYVRRKSFCEKTNIRRCSCILIP